MARVVPPNNNLNNYLITVLGLTQPQCEAVNAQGLTTFRSLENLKDKDIDKVVEGIRKPGGTIPNPRAGEPGQQATIPNPGTEFGFIPTLRLKMLRHYCAYMTNVQRIIVTAEATLDRLDQLWDLKEAIDDEDDKLIAPEPITNTDDFRTTKEDIDNYLRRKRGANDCPLSYIVRDNVNVPMFDLGFGIPTYDDEMILRAPHIGAVYQQDNAAVWQIMRQVTHGGPAWNWVSTYQRTMDGRSAYFALKEHYQGSSFVARLRAEADKVLETLVYDGRSRNFTFERYCEKLNRAFEDLDEAGERLSEARKIRVFLRGLSDPSLMNVKTQIQATPALADNFTAAVNFTAQYIATSIINTPARNRNVSATGRTSGRGNDSARGRGHGRGRGESRGGRGGGRYSGRGRSNSRGGGRQGAGRINDRYYTHAEWHALSAEEKQRVRDLRNGQDRRRSVAFVSTEEEDTRNVRQRTDDMDTAVVIQMPEQRNVGAVMSQRRTPNEL